METLEHNDLKKTYEPPQDENVEMVPVKVSENYKTEEVILTIDKKSLYLTLEQTRDLAREMRRSANLISKNMMDRGVKPKKNGRRRR